MGVNQLFINFGIKHQINFFVVFEISMEDFASYLK